MDGPHRPMIRPPGVTEETSWPSDITTPKVDEAPDRYLRPAPAARQAIDPTAKEQFVDRGIVIDGEPLKAAGQQDTADFQAVTTDFFAALGAPIVQGRGFSARDRRDAPAVAVVNQAFVDRYLPGRNAVGKRLRFGDVTRSAHVRGGDRRGGLGRALCYLATNATRTSRCSDDAAAELTESHHFPCRSLQC